MKKLIIPTLALTVVQNTAFAAPGTATGPTALALAAVIAQHSPAVRTFDKRVIALREDDTRRSLKAVKPLRELREPFPRRFRQAH